MYIFSVSSLLAGWRGGGPDGLGLSGQTDRMDRQTIAGLGKYFMDPTRQGEDVIQGVSLEKSIEWGIFVTNASSAHGLKYL